MAAALAAAVDAGSGNPCSSWAGYSSITCSPRPGLFWLAGYVGKERLAGLALPGRTSRRDSCVRHSAGSDRGSAAIPGLLGQVAPDDASRGGRTLCLDRVDAARLAAGSGLSVPMVWQGRPSGGRTGRAPARSDADCFRCSGWRFCSSSAAASRPVLAGLYSYGCSLPLGAGAALYLLDGLPGADQGAVMLRRRAGGRRLAAFATCPASIICSRSLYSPAAWWCRSPASIAGMTGAASIRCSPSCCCRCRHCRGLDQPRVLFRLGADHAVVLFPDRAAARCRYRMPCAICCFRLSPRFSCLPDLRWPMPRTEALRSPRC